jgi:alpha-D-xyloside xylohydrolase
MTRSDSAADFAKNLASFSRLESLVLKSTGTETAQFETDGGLPVSISSPTAGVFRLQFGKVAGGAYGLMVPQETAEPITVEEVAGGFVLKTFFTDLQLSTKPLRATIVHRMRPRLASCDGAAAQGVKLPPLGFDAQGKRWCVAFELGQEDAVYGLGEQYATLNRRGQSLTASIPFCWSPRGWGVMALGTGQVDHHVGDAGLSPGHYVLQAATESLDLFLFGGTPTETINAFTNLTGKASVPPMWSLGAWVVLDGASTSQQVMAAARTVRDHGIAADVVAVNGAPAFTMTNRMGFEWNQTRFPEHTKLLATLRSMHLHFSADGEPLLADDSPAFEEMATKGWLLKDAHGKPGLVDANGGKAGVLDFMHPDAYAFWRDRHENVFKEGVDAINTSHALPDLAGLRAHNGETGAALAHMWPMLYNRAVFDATQKYHGDGIDKRALVMGKDGFIGSQRYPVQHSGTQHSGWDGLAASIRGAQSYGATGQPCYPVQIGGPADGPADLSAEGGELYARWAAASVFFSHLQFVGVDSHGPLAYDSQVETAVKKWMRFRYRLIPYVMGALEEASRNGLPASRAMALAFPDDKAAHAHETQYLFGPALLVAPILQPGGKRIVYFPRGERWYDLATGVKYEGGTLYEFEKELDGIPVFGREGHILCLGPEAQSTAEINTIRPVTEAWLFGLPAVDPCVTSIKVKVMQMQGNAYIKGLEGTKVLAAWGYEVSRRGAEVKVVKKR